MTPEVTCEIKKIILVPEVTPVIFSDIFKKLLRDKKSLLLFKKKIN